MMHKLWVLSISLFLGNTCFAELKLAPVFADGMVLQCDTKVALWGWAEPGAKVTASFSDQNKSVTAESDGRFMMHLDSMEASANPQSLLVIADGETVEVKNILVGEVWLCAGQSNMRMTVRGVADAEQEISSANYPNIRFFTVPKVSSKTPQTNVNAIWTTCSPETVGSCTAAGYFFGRRLHRDLKVPIGLIDVSYGGATIYTFMDADTVRKTPASDLIYKRDKVELAKEKPRPNQISSYCYNAMVHPIVPFTVRGTIWYQGESNVGTPEEYISWYRDYMEMMRAKFKSPEMPFYHVQLAGFANQTKPRPTHVPPDLWARFRLAQAKILEQPHTGMATAMDIGMKENIHPKNKQEVGRRLALCALNKTYDKTDVVCEGPMFQSLQRQGSTLVVSFSKCHGGLKLKGDFGGFTGVLEDGTTVAVAGKITGPDTVELNLDNHPIQRLRYAYANYPDCPLVNGAGLPALSFDQPVNQEKN
ncbi:MAG: sialate O-acetylesterase [Lentisphaeria bacterium]|nr:sialate O-acetylesterase [Lentisphaeria bacterium]